MLTISKPAYERLSQMLADRPDDVCVRIYFQQGRARIRPGRQHQGDKAIEHNGRTVLLFDEHAARQLDQRTIGIRQTADGPRLKLQRVESENPSRGH